MGGDQDIHSDSLFIFNDNEEYHDIRRTGMCNAMIRKFKKHSRLAIPKST